MTRKADIPRWFFYFLVALTIAFHSAVVKPAFGQSWNVITANSPTWTVEHVFWNESSQPQGFLFYDCDKGPALYLLPRGSASIKYVGDRLCENKQYAVLTSTIPTVRTILTYKPTGLSFSVPPVGLISNSNGQTISGISNKPGGKIAGVTLLPRVRTTLEATIYDQYGAIKGVEFLTFDPPVSQVVFQTVIDPIGSVSLRMTQGEPSAGFLWRSNGAGDNAEIFPFK